MQTVRERDYRRRRLDVRLGGGRRTSRHCVSLGSVGAGGGCGDPLTNVHPEKKQIQDQSTTH